MAVSQFSSHALDPRHGVHPDSLFDITAHIGASCVLNRDLLAATTAPTNPSLAATLSDATTGNRHNCHLLQLPDGCAYLDLFAEWNTGASWSTDPIVRLFGLLPDRATREIIRPYDVSTSYFQYLDSDNPSYTNALGDWRPIGNLAASTDAARFVLTLSTTSYLTNATTDRGAPTTVNVQGCRKVLALVSTAGIGPTRALLVAQPGR